MAKLYFKNSLYNIEKSEKGFFIRDRLIFAIIDKSSIIEEKEEKLYEAMIIKEIVDKKGNKVPILQLLEHRCRNRCGEKCSVCGQWKHHQFKTELVSTEIDCGYIRTCECGYREENLEPHFWDETTKTFCLRCGRQRTFAEEKLEIEQRIRQYVALLQEQQISNSDKTKEELLSKYIYTKKEREREVEEKKQKIEELFRQEIIEAGLEIAIKTYRGGYVQDKDYRFYSPHAEEKVAEVLRKGELYGTLFQTLLNLLFAKEFEKIENILRIELKNKETYREKIEEIEKIEAEIRCLEQEIERVYAQKEEEKEAVRVEDPFIEKLLQLREDEDIVAIAQAKYGLHPKQMKEEEFLLFIVVKYLDRIYPKIKQD